MKLRTCKKRLVRHTAFARRCEKALPQMLDELEALRKAGFRVNADGHQFVRGVTLSQAPLGDEWDARWRADLDALEKTLGEP